MSTVIKDPITGALLEVTANRQIAIKTANPTEISGVEHPEQVGSIRLQAECDAGTVTGVPTLKALEVSNDYRLRVGTDQTAFNELFPGAAFNTTLWTNPTTTMTTTSASGFANLNAGASLASGAVARLTTWRSFPCYKSYTTYIETDLQFTSTPVIGNVCEWGAIIHTGTAAPTDGVFFRINAVGELRCIINNNGIETQSATLDFNALVGVNMSRAFLIYIVSNKAVFWIDNNLVAEIETPAAQGSTTSSQNLPLSFRNYNSSATSTAQTMKVAFTNVTLADQNTNKLWNTIICGMGGNSSQGQTGGTIGNTALHTNNQAPGVGAAMTNTTAALGSGLGGQFAALPTLAVNTDGIICSYQVPIGTAISPGKSLYINGVNIDSAVTTVLAGNASPIVYAYSIAYGHTAVSLATTESATTKAPRRKFLGVNSFAAAAPVGTVGTEVKINMENPIVVQPGEFIQIIAKNVGAVTTTGVVTFFIDLDGYFE
jgi:hypothetical protein